MNIEVHDYIKNLNENGKKILIIDDYKILLVNHNGKIYAIDATCTHEDESLEDGYIDDECIECPKHGAKFDLKTGEVRSLPAFKPLKTYEIVLENGKYFLRT